MSRDEGQAAYTAHMTPGQAITTNPWPLTVKKERTDVRGEAWEAF